MPGKQFKKVYSDTDLINLKSSLDIKERSHDRHAYTLRPLSTQIHSVSKHEERVLRLSGYSKRNKNVFWKIFTGGLSLQVYKVVVNNGSKSWFIFRRYNEFHTLFEKVRYFVVLSLQYDINSLWIVFTVDFCCSMTKESSMNTVKEVYLMNNTST